MVYYACIACQFNILYSACFILLLALQYVSVFIYIYILHYLLKLLLLPNLSVCHYVWFEYALTGVRPVLIGGHNPMLCNFIQVTNNTSIQHSVSQICTKTTHKYLQYRIYTLQQPIIALNHCLCLYLMLNYHWHA